MRGLSLRYPDGKTAVRGVSLDLDARELVCVLGSNGSGKSSLLRCVARLRDATAGRIHVAGEEMTRLRGRALRRARSRLAMIGQSANLVRRRSVLANVITGTLARHGDLATAPGALPATEFRLARACLDQVGLGAIAEQRASTLSGGQAQRVAIARALAQRPRLLLADEPVASLDPEAAVEVMRLLRRLADDGLGVVCVLHQPQLAARYADRVIGLRDGAVAFSSAAAELRDSEVNALYGSRAA